MMNKLKRALIVVFVGLFGASASGADPSTQPMPPLIGTMRPAMLDARHYLYIELTCTIDTLIKKVGPAFNTLEGFRRDQGIVYTSGAIVRFPKGMNLDGGTFTVQAGYCVDSDTAAPTSAQVIELPAFKCATLNYTGPMPHLKDAYDAIEADVHQAEMKPTGEIRESYLYWENFNSDNDLTQLQVGVE